MAGLPERRVQERSVATRAALLDAALESLVELGYDVTLTNWRAMFAPPVVDDEQVAELEALLEETVATAEWKDAVARNYWKEVPLGSEDLPAYVAEETERIAALFEEIRG